ncbi:P-loop containing nucleoside triphosphate hydrolase protein [Favolaschia claudopus]|uniref:P-loop containing nucleoside triphosphate hydrolase protein n=1 Tax=Favolaschia claudopus TaxID=2862362 RepID=A0AAW0BS12_9AGAR
MNVLTILIDLQVASEARKTKSWKPCPFPVAAFTGQRGILEKMHQLFSQNQGFRHIFVLHGLGGSGKSQIALKFVEEAQANKRFSQVFFVDATNEQTAQADLKLLAHETSEETVSERLYWLANQKEEWLLLFDNADDTQLDIGKFFPSCAFGNILITTRNPEICSHAEHCPDGAFCQVSNLELEDARNLLLKVVGTKARAPNKEELATDIVKELHCFALAVAQAGGYIYACGKLTSYLALYRSSRDKLLAQIEVQGQSHYSLAVYATWNLSYTKLTPEAKTLLQICSQLHHQDIREEIFQRAMSSDQKLEDSDMQEVVTKLLAAIGGASEDWDSFVFNKIARELQSYSLIEQNQLDDESYNIHPLVQHWSAMSISKTSMKQYVLVILGLSVPWKYEIDDYIYRRQVCIHIVQAVDQITQGITKDIGLELALVLHEQGYFQHAEELEVVVVEARTQLLGKEHPDTLTSMANLASTYFQQGKWGEAEVLQVEVLELTKRVLGKEHPDTLRSMANLARTYAEQGKWSEAEELEVAVLEARKRLLGKEHTDTLRSMANLARTYAEQGKWSEAEELEVAVLEARKRLLGKEHPGTLRSMANFARTYSEQGKWSEAEELEVAVLEARKRVLGKEHPSTLASMTNLASTYWDQGKWGEAEGLEVAVLELTKRVLGTEHPSTLTSMGNLASTYSDQGKWSEAEELQVEVLEARKRLLGKEHPNTLMSMANLASTYLQQGKWGEAEELQVAVLEARKRLLGKEHPSTLTSMASLARTYSDQGQWSEAEELEVGALEARKRLLGKEHPDTLLSMANLARTYLDQGKWRQTEELEVAVLEARKQVLGKEHPLTLRSMANLAATYERQGHDTKAQELRRAAKQIEESQNTVQL